VQCFFPVQSSNLLTGPVFDVAKYIFDLKNRSLFSHLTATWNLPNLRKKFICRADPCWRKCAVLFSSDQKLSAAWCHICIRSYFPKI